MDFNIIFFPLLLIWALALFLIILRRDTGAAWKISALLLSIFYALWFWNEISHSFNAFQGDFKGSLPLFLTATGSLTSLALLFLWPLGLLAAFFSVSTEQSKSILRILILVTLFFWIFRLIDYILPDEMKSSMQFLSDIIAKINDIIKNPPK